MHLIRVFRTWACGCVLVWSLNFWHHVHLKFSWTLTWTWLIMFRTQKYSFHHFAFIQFPTFVLLGGSKMDWFRNLIPGLESCISARLHYFVLKITRGTCSIFLHFPPIMLNWLAFWYKNSLRLYIIGKPA